MKTTVQTQLTQKQGTASVPASLAAWRSMPAAAPMAAIRRAIAAICHAASPIHAHSKSRVANGRKGSTVWKHRSIIRGTKSQVATG